jgi:tetraacyldisaccharide 4'-kinase
VARQVAAKGAPVFRAQLNPAEDSLAALQGRRVVAFAGIGDPARFFRTLRSASVDVAVEKAFPDHHAYSAEDIAALVVQAQRDALTLVTTKKDMVKLRGLPGAEGIVPFAVTLAFDDAAALRMFVMERLNIARTMKLRTSP